MGKVSGRFNVVNISQALLVKHLKYLEHQHPAQKHTFTAASKTRVDEKQRTE